MSLTLSFHTREEVDAEIELFTAYVLHTMTPDEELAFEERLVEDEAFFDHVAPLLKFWYSDDPNLTIAATDERIRVRKAERMQRIRRAATWAALPAAAVLAFIMFRSTPKPAPSAPRSVAIAPVPSPAAPERAADSRGAAPKRVRHPLPKATVQPQRVVVTEPAATVNAAEPAVTMDSLPPAGLTVARVEPSLDIHSPQVFQVAPPIPNNTSFGIRAALGALGEKLGGIWTWVRTPRTHRPF